MPKGASRSTPVNVPLGVMEQWGACRKAECQRRTLGLPPKAIEVGGVL